MSSIQVQLLHGTYTPDYRKLCLAPLNCLWKSEVQIQKFFILCCFCSMFQWDPTNFKFHLHDVAWSLFPVTTITAHSTYGDESPLGTA